MTGEECLIVGAAPAPAGKRFYTDLVRGYRVVIAADAAGEWCVGLGRTPDVVVGDFDSAEEGARGRLEGAGVTVVRLPIEKDVSDLEACLAAARDLGVASVDVTAAFQDRIDHTLAALGTVARAAELKARVREPGWTAWALDGRSRQRVDFELPRGGLFSLVSPAGASGVTVDGARYPLRNAVLEPLSSLGISNVAAGDGPVRVSVTSGALLVIAPD